MGLLFIFIARNRCFTYSFRHMSYGKVASLSVVASVFFASALPTVRAAVNYTCPALPGAASKTVVGSICYAFYRNALSWSAAEAACNANGGHLARIRSSAIDDSISYIAITSDVWFGASDNNSFVSGASEGSFFWIGDGTAFWTGGQGGSPVGTSYANWGTDEPNDFGSNEDCALKYASDGRWNDYVCGNGRYYVCEFAATEFTVNAGGSGIAPSGGNRRSDKEMQGMIDKAAEKIQQKALGKTAANLMGGASSSSSKASIASSASSKITTAKSASSVQSTVATFQKIGENQRIVATTNLNLRTDSRINSTILLVLHKGYVVTLLNIANEDWAYVQTESGYKGYVWRKHLTK